MTHHWTKEEDALLVELRLARHYRCEKSFKASYLQKLENMLTEKAPGHSIRAVPHILSRIKTPKNGWQVMYDMVYVSNTNRFRWDPETKCVTEEPAMCDVYLEVDYASIFVLAFG